MADLLSMSDEVLVLDDPVAGQGLGLPPAPPEGLDTALFEHDGRLSRRDLRTQISRLEDELARLFASAFPRQGIEWRVAAPGGGPRILGVTELERVRDALITRVRDAQVELGRMTDIEQQNRGLIEDMTADPAAYPWVRVSNQDIGEPGCKHWHSRPRYGIFGWLLGWWQLKISSGCPLANGRPFGAAQRTRRDSPDPAYLI